MPNKGDANRTNQCNPNHQSTGPGHKAEYQGAQSNRDNRSNQLNPNNPEFGGGNKK
ncbi:uncharacterized protein LOC100119759 [Nasonia vitripennis]|uniref:Uncharacterized protein n=1 Tax=Nasonia vitripennis TaxID=7425 RepID=A0A7M7GAT4_NASVI|nr:uncharacterized protein LOC100119759 [Nasonia vitripennis]